MSVGADDVAVVQGGGGAGLAMEAAEVGGVLDAVLGEDLDGHAVLHQGVFGEIDVAHAAGAEQVQQLVLLDEEPLVAALQQILGLPGGDEPLLDEMVGDGLRVAKRRIPLRAMQCRCRLVKPLRLDQAALPHQVQKIVRLRFGHSAPADNY